MSEIKVINNAHLPIHGALSWAGIQQQCFNDLAVGGEHKFLVGLGWHDLVIMIGSEKRKFESANNNKFDLSQLLERGVELFIGGAGLAANVSAAVAPNIKVYPVAVPQLYAPHGYEIKVTGGKYTGKKEGGKFVITKMEPLQLHWHNNTNNNSGDVTGKS